MYISLFIGKTTQNNYLVIVLLHLTGGKLNKLCGFKTINNISLCHSFTTDIGNQIKNIFM